MKGDWVGRRLENGAMEAKLRALICVEIDSSTVRHCPENKQLRPIQSRYLFYRIKREKRYFMGHTSAFL